MSTRYLEALFNPSSIAVLGASERPNNLGGMVLRNLLASEFPGRLQVVNSNDYPNVHGVPCVAKVGRMPFSPDLAIICTPPETVPKMIKQLGDARVRTVMVLTGGMSRAHSETGRPLMYLVRDAARKSGIRVLGPNTIGIMVPSRSLNATYAHMGVLEGKIGFVGQSGAIASAIIDWSFARGVGFSHFLTLGDSMDIDHDDLIDYLAQDSNTRAILLHIESIPNPRRFISAVRAASRTKPIIAVKSGRVPESEWMPQPLPDGLTRSDPIYDAVLQRAGVLRVNGLDEMFDALESLSRMRRVRREELVIMANGVGPGVLAVDRLSGLGGHLAKLSKNSIDELAQILPPYWTRKNPIDLNYDASPELYAKVLGILARDPNVANVLAMYAPSLTEDNMQIADSVIRAAKQSRLNIFTCWLGQSTVLDARDEFYAAGVPTFFSPEKAVKAFMHYVNHQRNQRLLRETPESFTELSVDRSHARKLVSDALRNRRNHLSNREAREVIADYGIATIETWYADDIEEAVELSRSIGGRSVNVTLIHEKSCHPFLEEKTGQGRYHSTAYRLVDEQSVRNACQLLMTHYREHFPQSGFLGFAVQCSHEHMGGIGFSVGITRDPLFGPLVVCGSSGASVNVMTDRELALPPLNMVLARELLSRTHMFRLLQEYSAKPEHDTRAVCETLVTLSQIVIDIPEIKGLEVLPLLFDQNGAVAVDIAIDLDEPGRLVIQPYPRELEEWIVLPKSGRRVIIRPVRAEDEPAHVEFHERQSPDSIRYRFFQYRNHFSHDDVAQMVQIDYDREMAFVANAERVDGEGEETLGTVRVWTDADNLQCEFAVMVHDECKGEGLGVMLMNKMIEYCRERGTVEMVGNVLPDNQPMLKLARRLGFRTKYNPEEEVIDLWLELNDPEDDWQRQRLAGAGGGMLEGF